MENKETYSIELHELDKITALDKLIEYLRNKLKVKTLFCTLNKKDWDTHTNNPFAIVSVSVNSVTFVAVSLIELISLRSEIFKKFRELVAEILENKAETTDERINILKRQEIILKDIMISYSYFNLFRFSDDMVIFEKFNNERRGTDIKFVNFDDSVWDGLRKIYTNRFQFFEYLYDHICKLSLEYEEINSPGYRDYGWKAIPINNGIKTSSPSLEIYELAFALSNSPKLVFRNGKNKDEFIKDLLSFFNLPIDSIASLRSTVADRSGNKPPFLNELSESFLKDKPFTSRAREKKKKKDD